MKFVLAPADIGVFLSPVIDGDAIGQESTVLTGDWNYFYSALLEAAMKLTVLYW